jgi:tRNA 2-thiouridine synthesizing protein A
MKTVDARGFSCPEPVIQTQNGLKALPPGEQLEVLVETVTSRENVRRMAESKGWQVAVEEVEGGFRLVIGK